MTVPALLLAVTLAAAGCNQGPAENGAADSSAPGVTESNAPDSAPQPPPPAPLDLSDEHLQGLLDESGDAGDALPERDRLLPDYFAEEKDPRKVKVTGGVLTDEEAASLRDAIDGAEVKVEVRTR